MNLKQYTELVDQISDADQYHRMAQSDPTYMSFAEAAAVGYLRVLAHVQLERAGADLASILVEKADAEESE